MADTQTPELGSLKLPDTEPYRVVIVGASYNAARETIGPNGQPQIVYVSQMAGRGQEVQLVPAEARRLRELGAVRPAGEARGYDEMSDDELKEATAERGINVQSSSADPNIPRREDYLNALELVDKGLAAAATSSPGGVVATSEAGTSGVLLDGQTPALSTAEGPPSEGDLARGSATPHSPALQPDEEENTKRSGARRSAQAKG